MGTGKTVKRPPGGFKDAGPESKQIKVGIGDVGGAQARTQQLIRESQQVGFGSEAGKRRDTQRTQELRKSLQGAEFSRLQREIDLARGRDRALQEFGEGALGRVREDRSQGVSDLFQRQRNFAEQGLGSQFFEASRERGRQAIDRNSALQARQLAASQAAGGVRGGLAAAQQLALQQQQQQQVQDLERDLFLQDVGQRQQATATALQSLQGIESDELGRRQFNLEQGRREALGRITGSFAEAGLGVAERTAAQSAEAARAAGEASRQAARGGGKK